MVDHKRRAELMNVDPELNYVWYLVSLLENMATKR